MRANGGDEIWSPLALSFAKEVAKGQRRIHYQFDRRLLECDDPAAEYAQMVHVERQRFPSLNLVPAEPEIYAEGLRRNTVIVNAEIQQLQSELHELGALAPKQRLPEQLVPGHLHEALDAFAEHDVKTRNVWPGTDRLKQSGHRRLEMIDRFKERHKDIPLSTLGHDAVTELIRYWCKRPPKKNRKTGKFDGPPVAISSARHHRKELDRFFRWLDATDKFEWLLPRGFTQIDRSVKPRKSLVVACRPFRPRRTRLLNLQLSTDMQHRLNGSSCTSLCTAEWERRSLGGFAGEISCSITSTSFRRLLDSHQQQKTPSSAICGPRRRFSANGYCGRRRSRWFSGGWNAPAVTAATCFSLRKTESLGTTRATTKTRRPNSRTY